MIYSKSILLIDDDSISNYLVTLMFNSLDNCCPYHIVNNPELALNYLKNLDKATKVLVLLDIHMPVLDAFEFLGRLEDDNEIDKNLLDIVLISSSIAQKDIDKAKSIGINKFLLKPIKKESLQAIIDEFETE